MEFWIYSSILCCYDLYNDLPKSANISFVAENPSVLKYLIKKTAVVLVLPSPKI